MDDIILTAKEVATYLNVSDLTIYDWAEKGEIPASKVGNVWRFKKNEIDNWKEKKTTTTNNDEVQIKNILLPNHIIFISKTKKEEAIVELAKLLSQAPQIKNAEELVTEILKREQLMSTAIGCGIAIPHVRLSSITDLVMAVGVCKNNITDFQAIDDEPVNLLFMIAAAYNQHSYYLKTISYLSGKLKKKELREKLISATTENEIYETLINA